ncbi:MAG TPA: hypothetical protein VHL78_06755 [Actinomycetota bacterium]|nr:hypothetical protein [Actinomycetota bacterium]
MTAFEHPALVYEDLDGFLAGMVPFVAGGLERSEPVFQAVGRDEVVALRSRFGEDVPGLRIVDTGSGTPTPPTVCAPSTSS